MSHFECHLNRLFWLSKKVVRVVQVGGKEEIIWTKSKTTANQTVWSLFLILSNQILVTWHFKIKFLVLGIFKWNTWYLVLSNENDAKDPDCVAGQGQLSLTRLPTEGCRFLIELHSPNTAQRAYPIPLSRTPNTNIIPKYTSTPEWYAILTAHTQYHNNVSLEY